jgi:hypothetical protein
MNIRRILSHSGPIIARASSTFGVCEGLQLGVEKRKDWSWKAENIIKKQSTNNSKTKKQKIDLYGLV